MEKFLDIVFGNRGDSQFRVGTRDSKNIMTMFEKIEKHMKKVFSKNEENKDEKIHTLLTDFYALVCNASHPNYDAHNMIGNFDYNKSLWRGLEPK